MANWKHARAPGGEGVEDLKLRLETLVEDLARTADSFLLVTHAGPIRVLRALSQKRTLDDVWSEIVTHLSVEPLAPWPVR